MKDKLDIRLRMIQQESNTDKANYLALQKSVAILKDWERDDEEKLNEWSWQDAFKSKQRICYVIEKMPGNVYCGECAVKNISDEIPEIEIELMKEYQGQGIGYLAIIDMLNKLASDYGKVKYYAKVEPDNYASRFLFEKLRAQPVGVSRDYTISDEREERFIERSRYLLDQDLEEVAKKFSVVPETLLTHFLVYQLNVNDINEKCTKREEMINHREKIDCPRKLTREKYKETLLEFLDGLQQIKETITKDELNAKIKEMEKKYTERVDKLGKSINLAEKRGYNSFSDFAEVSKIVERGAASKLILDYELPVT